MGPWDLRPSRSVSSLVSLLVPRNPSRVLQKPPTQNVNRHKMSSKKNLFCSAKGPEMCGLRVKILLGYPYPTPIKHQQKYCTNRSKVSRAEQGSDLCNSIPTWLGSPILLSIGVSGAKLGLLCPLYPQPGQSGQHSNSLIKWCQLTQWRTDLLSPMLEADGDTLRP